MHETRTDLLLLLVLVVMVVKAVVGIVVIIIIIIIIIIMYHNQLKHVMKVKVKRPRYRSGVAQRVPGS